MAQARSSVNCLSHLQEVGSDVIDLYCFDIRITMERANVMYSVYLTTVAYSTPSTRHKMSANILKRIKTDQDLTMEDQITLNIEGAKITRTRLQIKGNTTASTSNSNIYLRF